MFSQVFTYVRTYQIVHFKCVQFTECQLYLSNAVKMEAPPPCNIRGMTEWLGDWRKFPEDVALNRVLNTKNWATRGSEGRVFCSVQQRAFTGGMSAAPSGDTRKAGVAPVSEEGPAECCCLSVEGSLHPAGVLFCPCSGWPLTPHPCPDRGQRLFSQNLIVQDGPAIRTCAWTLSDWGPHCGWWRLRSDRHLGWKPWIQTA